jgi:hypothetical protein
MNSLTTLYLTEIPFCRTSPQKPDSWFMARERYGNQKLQARVMHAWLEDKNEKWFGKFSSPDTPFIKPPHCDRDSDLISIRTQPWVISLGLTLLQAMGSTLYYGLCIFKKVQVLLCTHNVLARFQLNFQNE